MAGLVGEVAMGPVCLKVAALAKVAAFYEEVLGLERVGEKEGCVEMGVGEEVLVGLEERNGARQVRGTTGLFHAAFLLPTRGDLGAFVGHLKQQQWPLEGASDHGVSEALYLSDPEGNGIEVYRDRQRGQWPFVGGRLNMGSEPVDLRDLGAAADREWDGAPKGTKVGHVHLKVNDLAAAERFYCEVLGLSLMQNFGREAAFVAVGGYHHHLGLNVWYSRGAPPAPPEATGLARYGMRVDARELSGLKERLDAADWPWEEEDGGVVFADPAGNEVVVRVGE